MSSQKSKHTCILLYRKDVFLTTLDKTLASLTFACNIRIINHSHFKSQFLQKPVLSTLKFPLAKKALAHLIQDTLYKGNTTFCSASSSSWLPSKIYQQDNHEYEVVRHTLEYLSRLHYISCGFFLAS